MIQFVSVRKSFSVVFCCSIVFLSSILVSCGGGESNPPDAETGDAEQSPVTLPAYTIIKSEVEGNDATYRVQVGDTLPNEQESIAIFKKITGIEDGPVSRNTGVYFIRAGFSPLADQHAHVLFTKSDDKPQYGLQSASNEELKKAEALSFDSIPGKKLIAECLDAAGAKIFIYQKASGEYFQVYMFGSGNYEIEPLKPGDGHTANAIVLNKTTDGEKWTFKEDKTGKIIEVYNAENTLYNSYKILKKG